MKCFMGLRSDPLITAVPLTTLGAPPPDSRYQLPVSSVFVCFPNLFDYMNVPYLDGLGILTGNFWAFSRCTNASKLSASGLFRP